MKDAGANMEQFDTSKDEAVGLKKVTFELQAEAGSEVYVAGSFNNWDSRKNPLTYENGAYTAVIQIPKGHYEYKFIVNGGWCADPRCPDWVPNGMGSFNSVIIVE